MWLFWPLELCLHEFAWQRLHCSHLFRKVYFVGRSISEGKWRKKNIKKCTIRYDASSLWLHHLIESISDFLDSNCCNIGLLSIPLGCQCRSLTPAIQVLSTKVWKLDPEEQIVSRASGGKMGGNHKEMSIANRGRLAWLYHLRTELLLFSLNCPLGHWVYVSQCPSVCLPPHHPPSSRSFVILPWQNS